MKSFTFAFLAIIVGATALPQNKDDTIFTKGDHLVDKIIVAVIQAAAQTIRDAGLDPVIIDKAQVNYVFDPLVAEVSAFVENLEFVGLSNIVINTMDYTLLASRLCFDVSLPEIRLNVGNSGLSIVLFGSKGNANFRGSASVRQIRLAGEVDLNIRLISGINIRSLSLNFSVDGIQSNITLNILDRDLSKLGTKLLNVIIPDFLAKNQATINDLLENIVWAVIDRFM